MSTLLIKNARCIATFDDTNPAQARELTNASLFIRDHRIAAMGPTAELPRTADEVIDARNQRLRRASDLNMKHSALPKEMQELQTPFEFYLKVRPAPGHAYPGRNPPTWNAYMPRCRRTSPASCTRD